MDLRNDSKRRHAGEAGAGSEEVEANIWFQNWDRAVPLLEDAYHLARWNHIIALLWFEDEDIPPVRTDRRQNEEDEKGLADLDGRASLARKAAVWRAAIFASHRC